MSHEGDVIRVYAADDAETETAAAAPPSAGEAAFAAAQRDGGPKHGFGLATGSGGGGEVEAEPAAPSLPSLAVPQVPPPVALAAALAVNQAALDGRPALLVGGGGGGGGGVEAATAVSPIVPKVRFHVLYKIMY